MRKVLITGATSGFGKLLVESFLMNGDLVIATGRNLNSRPTIFEVERKKYGNSILEIAMNVTNSEEISLAMKKVELTYGSLDILINNAGQGLYGALEDLTEDEIRYQMEVNFFGTVSVTKAFLPLLRKSHGKIFNISSVFGFMGFPLTSLYCASKYAVEGLTESLRGELAPHGVQLCLIEPGGYNTNFRNNLLWSKPNLSSVYELQINNYKLAQEKFSKRKRQQPNEVSEGILKLSRKSRLPMRKVFGQDARLSHYLKNCLPARIYFGIMDRVNNKIFLQR